MATRYIYLSDQLNMELRKEENASALICSLLNKHYEKGQMNEEEIIEDVKDKIKKKEHDIKIKRLVKEQMEREKDG